jgi:hypothetical protein
MNKKNIKDIKILLNLAEASLLIKQELLMPVSLEEAEALKSIEALIVNIENKKAKEKILKAKVKEAKKVKLVKPIKSGASIKKNKNPILKIKYVNPFL